MAAMGLPRRALPAAHVPAEAETREKTRRHPERTRPAQGRVRLIAPPRDAAVPNRVTRRGGRRRGGPDDARTTFADAAAGRCRPVRCARRSPTRRVRRLARERLGEAGHPARLSLRRRSWTCRCGSRRGEPFYDKDTLPLGSEPALDAGVRIVPGGSAIRDGAYHRAAA